MQNAPNYLKLIQEELKEIKNRDNYSSIEDAFVHWCLKLVANTDDNDKCSDAYTNGTKDLGIDGILILEGVPNQIFIIQAKSSDRGRTIVRSDIREFGKSAIKVLKYEKCEKYDSA